MSGYTGGAVPAGPDLALVQAGTALGAPLFAEGRYNTPALAAAAIEAGAHAVVVGTAITRPETITAWYAAAIGRSSGAERADQSQAPANDSRAGC
jgi:putative N-acetylmannosamine-6-phosphate epimerase